MGGIWEATWAHHVQHDMPRCQRFQKVHLFTVGRRLLWRESMLFLPGSSPRREMGRVFAMDSPSLPLSQPAGGSGGIWFDGAGLRAGGELPVLARTRVGVKISAWRRRDWRDAGSSWPWYQPHVKLSRSMVKDTRVCPPGSPVNTIVEAQIQML